MTHAAAYMNGKWSVTMAKWRRLLASVPIPDILAFVAVAAALLTIGASIIGGSVRPETLPYWKASERLALLFVAVLLPILISKTWLEYLRRKYDGSQILEFQKSFNALQDEAAEAATICLQLSGNLREGEDEKDRWGKVNPRQRESLDNILDFFEDVGFYLQGDQFSDEVAHHHFFYWIRGWYCVGKSYIEYYRQHDNEAYVNVEKLYNRTAFIESLCPNAKLLLTDKDSKLEFLREEGGKEIGVIVG